MRSAAALVALASLVAACSAPPPEPSADADTRDADDDAFSLCTIPCGRGQVCRNFVCVTLDGSAGDVARIDAAVDTVVRDAPTGFDTGTMSCCPMDRFPTCGCVRLGGSRTASGVCRTACGEGYPELWRQSTDVNGCAVWLPSRIPCADAGDDDGATADDAANDAHTVDATDARAPDAAMDAGG